LHEAVVSLDIINSVKFNACIFLPCIYFILLFLLESNSYVYVIIYNNTNTYIQV